MQKFVVYIAASIDGFIARQDGAVDWLDDLPNPNRIDHGYAGFYAGIDVVVMGRKTYEEILGFDVPWPYPDCKTFVITSQSAYEPTTPNTETIYTLNEKTIRHIQSKSKKNIWVVGGGQVVTSLINLNAIDEMILSIIPLVLGSGIRLFAGKPKETAFSLATTETFETGVVSLTYRRN
jgi:dihydrofolate reductase